MEKRTKVDKKKHAFAILDRLDKMRNDESRSNFKVEVNGQTILAQRDILIAASDYFDGMLSYDTKENQNGEVEMIDVDFESVKICIDFIYGREISIPSEKYEDLMFVAHMMQLKMLCDEIEEEMSENLNLKSFFKFKKISDLFECSLLRQKCSEFAEANFHVIKKEKDFNEIDQQYLLSLIESENIEISELEKLEILLQWVKHATKRNSELANLLRQVDLERIPIGCRRYFIENEQLISEDFECFQIFSISIMNSNEIPASNPAKQKTSILMFDHNFQNLHILNPRTNQVTETKSQKSDIPGNYSVVMLQNHIYILGQDKSVHRLKYSEEATTWERRADMIEDHGQHPPAVVMSRHIYVIAVAEGIETSTIEIYDPNRNKWWKFCQKQNSSNGSAVVAFEGCIYTLGGKVSHEITAEVEKLDVMKAEWITLAAMKKARLFAAAAAWKGNIIVAGGYNNYEKHKTVECYSVAMDQWTTLPSMNIERSTFNLLFVDGQIFALAGDYTDDATTSIEKYDKKYKRWMIVPIGEKLNIRATIPVGAEN